MEELREVILAHLEELHSTGLSNERYQLYVDTVYQCETVDALIDLAALELQLEAHEFLAQIVEQLEDLEDDTYSEDDLTYANSEGFGDEYDGFGDEEYPSSNNQRVDSNLFENVSEDMPSGFEDDYENNESTNSSGFEDDYDESDDIDPNVLAIQRALLGGNEDMSDPDYFDIDALLTKAGSVETEFELGSAQKVEYNDELANLLSVYPVEDEVITEEPSTPTHTDGFGQPVSFGQPIMQGRPSGFDITRQEVKISQPVQAQIPQPQQVRQQPPEQSKRPAQTSVAMNNAKNVFAGFSKRKK